MVPQAHPSTGALTRAAQDEDLERAAHLSRTNPSSLTVSLSNREGRSSLDKYSPDQPRVPAGHSDGGQWTSGGASAPTSPQTSPHLISGRSGASDAAPGSIIVDARGGATRGPIESLLAPSVRAGAADAIEDYGAAAMAGAGGPVSAAAAAAAAVVLPSSMGGGPVSGEIPGRSDLSYTWIPDQGLFILSRQIEGKETAVLAAQLAPGGVYVDAAGDAIAHVVGGKLVFDPQTVIRAANGKDGADDGPERQPEPQADSAGGGGRTVDLTDKECGGHVIEKHVAKTDTYLLNRLKSGVGIVRPGDTVASSSSFSSLEAATKLVNSTLSQNQASVDAVASGMIMSKTLNAQFNTLTGRSYSVRVSRQPPYLPRGGAPELRTPYGVRVVIVHDPNCRGGFRIVTAFPIVF